MKKISIFGATGSIGQSTIDVIEKNPSDLSVSALIAGSNAQKLADQAIKLSARSAIIADKNAYQDLKLALKDYPNIAVAAGEDAVLEAAADKDNTDIAVCAITGARGLPSLMASISAGIDVAIANKEPLVAAGEMVMAAAQQSGARILPLDSEHNAIFQVYESGNHYQIKRLILTGSGGPFRDLPKGDFVNITLESALKHPNWSMGPKNTIDSATLMNKSLEVIEASILFNMPVDHIDVVIQRQSIIHSMVEYKDGSILAQMGTSDMRTPIAHALAYPARLGAGGAPLDIFTMGNLSFEKPDPARFPFVEMVYDVMKTGLYARIAMNASNEIAVDEFLNGRISFLDIYDIVIYILEKAQNTSISSIEDVINFDQQIRLLTKDYIGQR